MVDLLNKGYILALDYGHQRIGVAVSDLCWWGATPLSFISNRKGHEKSLEQLKTLFSSYTPICMILVGLPVLENGEMTRQTHLTLNFIEFLKTHLVDMKIEAFDEYLTTQEAKDFQKSVGTRRSRRAQTLDSLSAKVLLESYLRLHRS